MKKLFLAITLIGLMSCNSSDDVSEMTQPTPTPPPIEVPHPCNCEVTNWLEVVSRIFKDKYKIEWQELTTYESCDKPNTNGEKVLIGERKLPVDYRPTINSYYSVVCK